MRHTCYTNKNNVLLKSYFLVLVAYHGSSSDLLILAFLLFPSETKLSKGGVKQETEFQSSHSDDTAVLRRYLRLVI